MFCHRGNCLSKIENAGLIVAKLDEIELGNMRFLKELSVANVQGIGSIPAVRLQRKLGSLSTDTLNKIKQALRSALDL
jgi:mRNA interferase MazF